MPCATTLTARASSPLVPSLRAIRTMVAWLEEGWEVRHSRSEDGVHAPQGLEISEDVPTYRAIEAELQTMGYEFHSQRKWWRIWRASRQLPAFSPNPHEAGRPVKVLRSQRGPPWEIPNFRLTDYNKIFS